MGIYYGQFCGAHPTVEMQNPYATSLDYTTVFQGFSVLSYISMLPLLKNFSILLRFLEVYLIQQNIAQVKLEPNKACYRLVAHCICLKKIMPFLQLS